MISIIVPVYQVEPYLSACISSILRQSCRDFELILIDDGSPDRCGAICDEYAAKDSRIRVVHQQNAGLSEARNLGLELARGSYFTFVDSDDLIPDSYLAQLLSAAEATGADLTACGSIHFPDEGETIPPLSLPVQSCEIQLLSGREACERLYERNPFLQISAWGKLFSMRLREQVRFPAGRIYEDQWAIPIALYYARTVAVIQTNLYYFRERANSITSRSFCLKNYDNIASLDHAVSFFRAKGETEILRKALAHRSEVLALWTVWSKIYGVKHIPPRYQMSLFLAFRILRKTVPEAVCKDYLNQVYPQRAALSRIKQRLKRALRRG